MLGNFQCRGKGAAARNTAEDAFLLRQRASGVQGFIVSHGDDPIDDFGVEYFGHEVGCPALYLVRRKCLTREQRSALGFGCHDLDLRARQLQNLARAGECAARTPTRDEMVESLASEIAQDFGAGGAAMVGRVGFVLELARQEPTVLLSELFRFSDHAAATLGRGGQDHLGAKRTHDLSAFDREGFDHHRDEGIPLGSANHCKCNSGVAGGCLDDRLAWLQRATSLGILNDRNGQPILDGMQRIECLALDEHRHMRGGEAIDANDRRVADGAQNAVVNHGPNGQVASRESPTPDRYVVITDAYGVRQFWYPEAAMKNYSIFRQIAAVLLLVSLCASQVDAREHGFSPETFRQWVDMRVGRGEPVYWYAIGTVYRSPDGAPLMSMEGVDVARFDAGLSTPTKAHQLSRKTFIYRDLETGAVLKEWEGKPLPPIAYPYQYITYELKGSSLETWVEQGAGPRKQRIGPGRDLTARMIGETAAFSAPLFLDFPLPSGQRMQSFEHYDFFRQPASAGLKHPNQISWLRFGDLPAGLGKGVMHMLSWRVDRYEDLPESMRRYLETEAPLWLKPPADIEEIRQLQQ